MIRYPDCCTLISPIALRSALKNSASSTVMAKPLHIPSEAGVLWVGRLRIGAVLTLQNQPDHARQHDRQALRQDGVQKGSWFGLRQRTEAQYMPKLP